MLAFVLVAAALSLTPAEEPAAVGPCRVELTKLLEKGSAEGFDQVVLEIGAEDGLTAESSPCHQDAVVLRWSLVLTVNGREFVSRGSKAFGPTKLAQETARR